MEEQIYNVKEETKDLKNSLRWILGIGILLFLALLTFQSVTSLTGYEYLANNTIAYWSFENGNFSNLVNSSYTMIDGSTTTNSSCIMGNCRDYDATSDYMNTTYLFNLPEFGVCGKMNGTANYPSSVGGIFDMFRDTDNSLYTFDVYQNKYRWSRTRSGVATDCGNQYGTYAQNAGFNYCIGYSNITGYIVLYINGVLLNNCSSSGSGSSSQIDSFKFGYNQGNYAMIGKYDELLVLNKLPSLAEAIFFNNTNGNNTRYPYTDGSSPPVSPLKNITFYMKDGQNSSITINTYTLEYNQNGTKYTTTNGTLNILNYNTTNLINISITNITNYDNNNYVNLNISSGNITLYVNRTTCNICNETCSPCGGGCNSTNLIDMYNGVNNFNTLYGDITGWNTTCLTNISGAFSYSDFNQDIGNWDTKNIKDISYLFYENTLFNQDLGDWNITNLQDATGLFYNTRLSTTNYDKLLNGWFNSAGYYNVRLEATGIKYSNVSIDNRQNLIDNFNWFITDGGFQSGACAEYWIEIENPCINHTTIKEFRDLNYCNTIYELPSMNGTALYCESADNNIYTYMKIDLSENFKFLIFFFLLLFGFGAFLMYKSPDLQFLWAIEGLILMGFGLFMKYTLFYGVEGVNVLTSWIFSGIIGALGLGLILYGVWQLFKQ